MPMSGGTITHRKHKWGAKTAGLAVASYGAVEISSSDFQLELFRKKLAERIGRDTLFPKAAIIKPPEK